MRFVCFCGTRAWTYSPRCSTTTHSRPTRRVWPPGRQARRSPLARVVHVERSLGAYFNDSRLLPNLVLHETEAWVFAAREQLGWLFGGAIAARMDTDVAAAGGPEGVNDDPVTAPSKCLAKYCSGYIKTQDGPLAIADLGVEGLRQQCPHLNDWLQQLEA